MASVFENTSYGKKISSSICWLKLIKAERLVYAMCCRKTTSSGFLKSSHKKLIPEGNTMMMVTAKVQNHAMEEKTHPYNNKSIKQRGTKLRRRLSNIFHFESAESGFLCSFLSMPGTNGNTHLAICQSPRIHLCLRCISVSYRSGYSSKSCTSVIRPERA